MAGGFKKSLQAYAQSAGYAEQALSAIRVVAANGTEKEEARIYESFLDRVKQAGAKVHMSGGFAFGFLWFVIFGGYSYALYVGSWFIQERIFNYTYDQPYRAGDIMTCFFGVIFGMFNLGMIGPSMKAVSEGKVAGKLAFDVIDKKPSIPINNPSGNKAENLKGAIELKNVTFHYPTAADNTVLENFSAVFEQGKTTALVGASGSGKSTIVQLLERFYDPVRGQVLIDGIDLKDYDLESYRQNVGYVGQEPALFNISIRDNMKMAYDADDKEIERALKKANSWAFLEKNKLTLDSDVGASGSQLSGGQKQRMAIARAFLKRPKILILDEATSALDKKNEKRV